MLAAGVPENIAEGKKQAIKDSFCEGVVIFLARQKKCFSSPPSLGRRGVLKRKNFRGSGVARTKP